MRKTMILRAVMLAIAGASATSLAAEEITAVARAIDVQPGSLADALESLAKQYGVNVIYPSSEIKGLTTAGVSGNLTPQEAVEKLLDGTALTVRLDSSGAMMITAPKATTKSRTNGDSTVASSPHLGSRFRLAQSSPVDGENRGESSRSEATTSEDEGASQRQKSIELEEIVVTGTHIRGVQSSSPLLMLTQEEIKLSGHANLGDVARAIPQNFSGGQNPGVIGASGVNNQNVTGASSFNLRGLGPDATLTLLNGVRLPYDGFSQATDVSVIPVAAIERLEVLLDGASATYGSDAVGGVANLIVKRDYSGAELSARYGKATEGGYVQNQYNAVVGSAWSSGGVLITGDVSRNTSVKARDRRYLSQLPNQDVSVYPELDQKGAFLSLRQELGSQLEANIDAFYTSRDTTSQIQFSSASRSTNVSDSTIWGVVPGLRYELPGSWSIEATAFLGKNEAETTQRNFSVATGALSSESRTCYCNEAESINIQAGGNLLSLPGGDMSVSIGGGHRRNSFDNINRVSNARVVEGSRSSKYGFAELNVPLVSAAQDVPFARRLSLNAAVRYEDYGRSDFGDVTTPKVGLIWSPVDSLDAKLSWGKSFKAPTLLQQYQDKAVVNILASNLGLTGLPAGTTVLVSTGGNPDLEAERAETLSAGFVVRPQSLPGFRLELSYFEIRYTDRVTIPLTSFTQILTNPALADFVSVQPPAAEQAALIESADRFDNFSGSPYDPDSVGAIVHNTYLNTSEWALDGLDVYATYTDLALLNGNAQITLGATWLDGTQQLTALAPELDVTGVISFPASFRARAGISWSRSDLTLSAFGNHSAGVRNTNLVTQDRGGSMTTLDLVVDYRWRQSVVGDIGMNLAVFNVFDKSPPYLAPGNMFAYPYDPTNYSPLGRNVALTLTKSF